MDESVRLEGRLLGAFDSSVFCVKSNASYESKSRERSSVVSKKQAAREQEGVAMCRAATLQTWAHDFSIWGTLGRF